MPYLNNVHDLPFYLRELADAARERGDMRVALEIEQAVDDLVAHSERKDAEIETLRTERDEALDEAADKNIECIELRQERDDLNIRCIGLQQDLDLMLTDPALKPADEDN